MNTAMELKNGAARLASYAEEVRRIVPEGSAPDLPLWWAAEVEPASPAQERPPPGEEDPLDALYRVSREVDRLRKAARRVLDPAWVDILNHHATGTYVANLDAQRKELHKSIRSQTQRAEEQAVERASENAAPEDLPALLEKIKTREPVSGVQALLVKLYQKAPARFRPLLLSSAKSLILGAEPAGQPDDLHPLQQMVLTFGARPLPRGGEPEAEDLVLDFRIPGARSITYDLESLTEGVNGSTPDSGINYKIVKKLNTIRPTLPAAEDSREENPRDPSPAEPRFWRQEEEKVYREIRCPFPPESALKGPSPTLYAYGRLCSDALLDPSEGALLNNPHRLLQDYEELDLARERGRDLDRLKKILGPEDTEVEAKAAASKLVAARLEQQESSLNHFEIGANIPPAEAKARLHELALGSLIRGVDLAERLERLSRRGPAKLWESAWGEILAEEEVGLAAFAATRGRPLTAAQHFE